VQKVRGEYDCASPRMEVLMGRAREKGFRKGYERALAKKGGGLVGD